MSSGTGGADTDGSRRGIVIAADTSSCCCCSCSVVATPLCCSFPKSPSGAPAAMAAIAAPAPVRAANYNSRMSSAEQPPPPTPSALSYQMFQWACPSLEGAARCRPLRNTVCVRVRRRRFRIAFHLRRHGSGRECQQSECVCASAAVEESSATHSKFDREIATARATAHHASSVRQRRHVI